MDKLISVIVPVYGVEKYLEKCVDSILEQTYSKLEIILVDDGSKDSSGEICDLYSEKDNRIKVIHKQNGGLSDARNAGLDICKGEYIVFLDSDDWIDKEYIKYLYILIEKYDTELSICEIVNITERGKILNQYSNNDQIIIMSEKESLVQLLKTEKFSTSVCGKMYHRHLFEYRRFPVGKLYEDIPVSYDIFIKGVKAVFGSRGLYFYLSRDNSITTNKFSIRRLDAVEFINKAMDEVVLKYPEFQEETYIRLFCSYFNLFNSFSNDQLSKKYYTITKKELKKYRNTVLFSKKSRKIEKIKAIVSIFDYRITQHIMKKRKE